MSSLELQQLRRVAGAVARLRGEGVREVTVRSDLRQLKVELESGLILVGMDRVGRSSRWTSWSCRWTPRCANN